MKHINFFALSFLNLLLCIFSPPLQAQEDNSANWENGGDFFDERDNQKDLPTRTALRDLTKDDVMPDIKGLLPVDYIDDPAIASSIQQKRISAIYIKGLRYLTQDSVLVKLAIRPNDFFSPEAVSDDIRTIYRMGFFKEVSAFISFEGDEIALHFYLTEHPTIRTITYEGNHELDKDDLDEEVDLKVATVLNRADLKRNEEKIKAAYVDKGYYLAQVSSEVTTVDDGAMVDVTFKIEERQEVKIHSISFVGNKALSAKQLKKGMQTKEGNIISAIMGTSTFKDENLQMDILRLQSLYYDNGYIKVKIEPPQVTISNDLSRLYINFNIEEGPQYNLGSLTFSGEMDLQDQDGKVISSQEILENSLSVKSGEVFNRTKLFNDIQRITTMYQDQGYAYANVVPESDPHDDLTVDINTSIEKGPLVYFGRIDIVGNTITRDKVIRREMRIVEGELYSATGINRSKARIFQLGYFEDVEITTNPSSLPNVVDVLVTIKEKPSGAFQLGAGYSTLEGFVLTGQITQNNFLGRGQYLSLQAQLSFGTYGRKLATLQFSDPYFLDSNWSMTGKAYITQEYYNYFQREATGLSPGFGYWLTDSLRINLAYTLEWVSINTDSSIYQSNKQVYYNLSQQGRSSALALTLSFDDRDNRLYPTKGHYHYISAEAAGKWLGSELDFQRININLTYYHPVYWQQLVFKANARLGYIHSFDPHGVPLAERYFPGGIYTMRGFEYRSLGPAVNLPTDGTNPLSAGSEFPIGGNKQIIFNLELEFPLFPAAGLKGVIFADAGNAYGENENYFYIGRDKDLIPDAYLIGSGQRVKPPLGLFYSVGFGVRWMSPMGLLRFEWGIPITKPHPDDKSIQFEFTIGSF